MSTFVTTGVNALKVPFIYCARLIKSLWDLDGIPPETVLENTGVDVSALESPSNKQVTEAQQRLIYERVSVLSESPWIGFYAGVQSNPMDMGPMGLGLTSSKTVGEMLGFNEKFLATQCPPCLFETQTRGSKLFIRCVEARPIPQKMQRISAEEVLGVWSTFPIPGLTDSVEELRVKFDRPVHTNHLKAYENLLPSGLETISFNQSFARRSRRVLVEVQFPREVAEAPMPEAHEMIYEANHEYCQKLLDSMRTESSLTDRIFDLLIENYTRRTRSIWFPKDISRELALSLKTLERKLDDEGTTPRRIINSARKLLLADCINTELTNRQLGKLIGFSNEKSFAYWFKQNYGCTRTQYRHSLR